MGSLTLIVFPFVLFAQTPVLVESFSASDFPPAGWDTTRSDTAMAYWIRYQTSGANPDSHHARVQVYKSTDSLRIGFSELVTKVFDLLAATGEESLSFWFRFSVGSQNMGPDDTVSVAIREDTAGWCDLWKLGPSGQSNVWAIARISLVSFNGYRAARLRFRFDDRPNGGLGSSNRYFWLDSVKVLSYAIGMVDGAGPKSGPTDDFLTIYPNPARTRIEFKLNPGEVHSAPLRESGALETTSRILSTLTSFRTSFQDFQTKRIELTVYDVSGRLIRSFALCTMPYALCWDFTDRSGRRLAAGVYVCEVIINRVREYRSIVLTR
jgi:hypothetical protein